MPVSHDADDLSNTATSGGVSNRVGLLQMLGRLVDPRSPQGKQYELVFVLACAVVATLAGATNYRQLGTQTADLPQSLLEKLGAKYYSRGFSVCDRAAAQRDASFSGRGYTVSPPFGCGWLPGSGCGEEPGVVVVPAGGGLVSSASS